MKKLAIAAILLVHSAGFADLAMRTRLEDMIRERAQATVKVYDPSAQANVQIKYKTIDSKMPGGLFQVSGTPSNPDIDDIAQVLVTVYSNSEKAPPGAEAAVANSLGLPKNIAKVEFKKWDVPPPFAEDKSINSDILGKIAQDFVRGLTSGLWLSVLVIGASILVSVLASAYFRARETRQQTKDLVAAAQAGSQTARESAAPVEEKKPEERAAANARPGGDQYLSHLNVTSLMELLGDCYWCEAEEYAHFIWRNLPVEKREELLAKVDYLNAYVPYIYTFTPVNLNVHEHPYYLQPEKLCKTSQDDLKAVVEKNSALWLKLSPLRQQRMELGLEAKIGAASSSLKSVPAKIEAKPSVPRTLPVSADFGDPNSDEEISLFENPDKVPFNLRSRIRTLVWLALADDETVTKTFQGLDARAIAQAWVGPKPVLERLEKCIPASKLELVRDYATKVKPSRRSTVFNLLVQAGLDSASLAVKSSDEKAAA